MSKDLWLAGAAGSTPRWAATPSHRTPAGGRDPGGHAPACRGAVAAGSCVGVTHLPARAVPCCAVWYVGSFPPRNSFILLSAAFPVAAVGSAAAASSPGFPVWFPWGERGRGERRFLILSVLLPGGWLGLLCTGSGGMPQHGCSPHVPSPGCPDPAEDAAGEGPYATGMSPSLLCCPAPRGACWWGGGSAGSPPALPAAPRRARKGCQPFVRLRRDPAPPWEAEATPAPLPQGDCSGGHGLGWLCPTAGWQWGSVPVPGVPCPQGGTRCLRGCLRCRWQRCLLFWPAWEATRAAVAPGGPHFPGPTPWGAARCSGVRRGAETPGGSHVRQEQTAHTGAPACPGRLSRLSTRIVCIFPPLYFEVFGSRVGFGSVSWWDPRLGLPRCGSRLGWERRWCRGVLGGEQDGFCFA